MLKFSAILSIVFLVFCGLASGKVLFFDDFDDAKEKVGEEPLKWEHLPFASGNSQITIALDPDNHKNKVAKTTGIGLYVPVVAGRENWRDYYWEFDWLWENDSYVGTIYRVEGAEAHFHGTRRVSGECKCIKIYTRKAGNWTQIASGDYPTELNKWYKHQLRIKGGKHEIRMKKSDDDTPFDKLKPVVEVENDTFKKGPVGMMGITTGVSYFDNIIVYENPKDILAVSPRGKIALTWGLIKMVRSH